MDKLTQKDKQKIQRQKRKETIARIAAMQTLPYEVSSFDKLEYALEVYCNGAFVRQIDVYDTYEGSNSGKRAISRTSVSRRISTHPLHRLWKRTRNRLFSSIIKYRTVRTYALSKNNQIERKSCETEYFLSCDNK